MSEPARLSLDDILARVPQQRPSRFIDRLLEVTDTRAVGEYTFRADEREREMVAHGVVAGLGVPKGQ